jgi:glucan phosphorylase
VDQHDAENIYDLLETEVVPEYFERGPDGVPPAWLARMRHALAESLHRFTARSMVQRYSDDYYVPAMRGIQVADQPTA